MARSSKDDAREDRSYGAEQARAGQQAGQAAHYDDEAVDRSTEKNRLGTWALILGIGSIVALMLPVELVLTLGVLICAGSIVLGVMGVRAASANLATTRAQAFSGLLLGCVSAVLYVATAVGLYLVESGAINIDDFV